jgi:hypothetical protein
VTGPKVRFIIIAWPEDHDEDLEQHACDIQDFINEIQMGCPDVISPVSDSLHQQIVGEIG